MATTIDQQVALDESLVPSTQRLRIGRSNFRLPSDIQSKESTLQVVYDVLRNSPLFRAFQTTQQYGAILPIELTTDAIKNSKAYKEYYACAMGEAAPKPKASTKKKKGEFASSTTPPTPTPTTTVESAPRLSVTVKGKQPSRAITPTEPTNFQRTEAEQLKITTQQYGAILLIELATDEIRNSKAYKEYYACAMREAAPEPKASARKKKDVQRTEAEQLKIVLKRSRQETQISQQRGSGTDEGTGSKLGVLDVPSDDSEEELSWNSYDDEDVFY
nr:hypothetical protein [Tanacetum cinerariifolium]